MNQTKQTRVFASIGFLAVATIIGLTFVGVRSAADPAMANPTEKEFTLDSSAGAPTANFTQYSIATGISSDVLAKASLQGSTISFGNGNVFSDAAAFSVPVSNSAFFVSVNNITAFTFDFIAEGTSPSFFVRALLYKESIATTLGSEAATIYLSGKSGVEQTVSVSGCQTLAFYFDDNWASAKLILTSLTVKWSC